MEHNIVRTICFAALVLSIASMALAEDPSVCSYSGVAGEWGYSDAGTLFPPNANPVLFAIIGRYTLDAEGNFLGTQTSSRGGLISDEILRGTATVNPDCTGTLTVGIYDQSGILLRSAVWTMVYVDSAREVRGILRSLRLEPNGPTVPAVLTDNAKRLFPGSRHQEDEQ